MPNNQVTPPYKVNEGSDGPIDVRTTLKPVPREWANVEAEKGETLLDLDKDGLPAHYKIGGKKHSQGGTPLKASEDSFIFSNTKGLRIKDENILNDFGKKKGAYTPADIAKQYDINTFRKILADPDSDKRSRETAELMISNYNLKLAKLALVQESTKGFPDGIPDAALPYIFVAGVDPTTLLPVDMQGIVSDTVTSTTKKQQGGPVEEKSTTTTTTTTKSTGPGKDDIVLERTEGESDTDFQTRLYQSQQDANTKGVKVYVKSGDKFQLLKGDVMQTTSFKDPRLGKNEGAFGYLEATINNDPGLQDAIYEGYKKHIADPNNRLSQVEKDRLLKMPKEDVIKNFMEGQKQVYAINASGMNLPKEGKEWTNDQYSARVKDLGFETPFDTDQIAMFQASYKGLQDASNTEAFKPKLKNFNLTPIGKSDQTYDGKPISPVDKIFGNTTAGQAVLPSLNTYSFEDVTPEEQKAQDLVPNTLEAPVTQKKEAPWWSQDITELAGRAGDYLTLKKYMPWAPKLFPKLANPTFVDPTRELAANAEQANIATQATMAFGTGPQSMGSRLSAIQGQGAGNAADTLSRYNNQNVQIANQFEQLNTGILNQFGMTNAQLATDLYDKTTIANQQFDNAKREAGTALREAFKTAITNRAQTQAMNELYPHYQIDPQTGGFVNFTQGSKLMPGQQNPTNAVDMFSVMRNDPQYSNISDEDLIKLIGISKGNTGQQNTMGVPDYMNVGQVYNPGNYQ